MAKPRAGPRPGLVEVLQQAIRLQQQGRFDEAQRRYRSVLKAQPDQADALHYLGVLRAQQGNPQEAARLISRALELRPQLAEAHSNLGNVLQALDRVEAAIASYERALELKPAYLDAHHNRGTALARLKRHAEALASFDHALALKPDHADALNDRGASLQALNRNEEAIASYDRALVLRPGYAEALNNRGSALLALNRHDEAIASYDRALALRPAHAEVLNNRGAALQALNRHAEAVASYEQALALNPDHKYAAGAAAHSRAHICDWRAYDAHARRIADAVHSRKSIIAPFAFLAMSESPADQLACARSFTDDKHPAAATPLWTGERYRHDRVRIAYLSADFHEHATAYLMAELFERHDRQRFEISAYSFGPDAPSAMRTRLMAAFERFVEVRRSSDAEVAKLLRAAEIDIAVDLKGYTGDSRPGILAHRPAPLQVNYLGYPGTLGAEYIDYILGDPIVTPEAHRACYAEKVVCLPDCYQVNDRLRRIAERTPTRTEAGLPERGFVFCSFNNNYKITPGVFDIWMRLLCQVEGSVLWLLEANPAAADNLRREAAARGVAPGRLVFAPRLALGDHLARHRLADLFLDTLPYNAHTTASDALWAGLPVLTRVGTTFAGRVAASLLTAVGLPELITDSSRQYEALALKFATDATLLQNVKDKLAGNRLTTPLFDADRFRCHLEEAYTTMWEAARRGEPACSFSVSAAAPGAAEVSPPAAVSAPAPDLSRAIQEARALHQQGQLQEAEQRYREVLEREPRHFAALHYLGAVRGQQGDPEDAIRLLKLALDVRPRSAEAHCNLGVTLARLNRHAEALPSFDQALAIHPDYPDALNGRAVTLVALSRHAEAIASYDRLLTIEPHRAEAHYRRGNLLRALGRDQEAVASYDRALALKADYSQAFNNRGNALQALRRYADALASYDRGLAIRPGHANALYNRGIVLTKLNRYAEAAASFDRVLEIDPAYNLVLSDAVHARAHACDWSDHAALTARLRAAVRSGALISPFAFLVTSDSPAEQLACARNFGRARYPAIRPPLWNGERYRHDRIRVAYLSADLHEHATAYLMAGLFERHDRSRFETTAVSFGPDLPGSMRTRLEGGFERFLDVRLKSDREVAHLLREMEIDIAVDLKGYTTDARSGILAHRPAPVQVNYLGYPGTMATDYIDYIVADRIVIPRSTSRTTRKRSSAFPTATRSMTRGGASPGTRRSAGKQACPSTRSCSAHSTTTTRSPRKCSLSGCACYCKSRAACCGC